MFFKKILIAVDDTPPSQYAVDVGLAIAREDGSPVVFAVALDPTLTVTDCMFASIRELAEQLASEIIDRAMKQAAADGVTATSVTIFEDPVDGIIDLAKRERAGLIAMGTHGRIPIAGFVRSVADEVLRKTNTPLCVIRRPRRGKVYHRILVPVVDDQLSREGAAYAVDVARSFGSTLLFSTIPNGSHTLTPEGLLNLMKDYAGEHGVKAEGLVLKRQGAISGTIAMCARSEECDAIIMASHARDGLPRLIEGSVAETTIRSSDIPVVVVRR